MKIMVFTNEKKSENQPDFRIYLNEQAQDGESSTSSSPKGNKETEMANAAASEDEGIL